ncbi:MAG TPA: hypothetical protein VGE53_00710 [Candidatus Paceibacterota bacterium]
MTNTNHHIEDSLERLSEVTSLRADEKAAGRDTVLAFMEKNPLPVRSPYAWLMAPGARYATALAVLVMVGGGGVVSADTAKPGDVLYGTKIRITEPARAALTFDPEEKTAFAIERTDRRLKEFAAYASSEEANPETTALIASSLSESIAEVSGDVRDYTETGSADSALKANADLQSVLEAHSVVLDTLGEQKPETKDDLTAIAASVDAGIATTENIEQEIVDALAPALTDDTSVAEQATETQVSISALLTELETQSAAISTDDRETITAELSEINVIIAEAWEAREAGDRKGALLLYTEADQRLSKLQTLVEADRDLGIGVAPEDEEASVE